MELIELLTQNLDVGEKQAKGGAGLLFQLAKDQLEDGEFSRVANLVPGVEKLIGEAPEVGGIAGALGGLADAFGGKAATVGNLATLAAGFSKLDIDSATVSKFVPIVLSFVERQGGEEIKGILEKVFK